MSFYCKAHGATDSVCSDCLDECLTTIDRLKTVLTNVINQIRGYYPEGIHHEDDVLKEAKALLKELE